MRGEGRLTRTGAFAALALCTVAGLTGCPPTPSGTASLTGTIRDVNTAAGIPGAKIATWSGQTAAGSATCDAIGAYMLADLPAGNLSYTFSANGYFPQTDTVTLAAGESLALEMADQRHDARKLHVAITMPVLHALRTKGVVNLTLSGFETDRLSMRFEGVTSVRGQEGRIGDLRFRGQGVSRMDLRDVPVRTADLDCEGVIKIDLTMAGGELTGSIKGVGELRYAGETSRESIQREGPCKVTRETRT